MPDSPSLETLYVRLYLDRHIMGRLAVNLRAQGFNVLRTEEAGKDRASDEEQLAFATQEGRSSMRWAEILTAVVLSRCAGEEALHHFATVQLHGSILAITNFHRRIDTQDMVNRGANIIR